MSENKNMKKKIWLIYDPRYRTNPDDAICFEVCDSKEEAIRQAPEYGNNNVIVEDEIEGG